MIISEIGIRNFKSFGNNEQVLKLNTEKGELILLVGENGAGKCVLDSTEIEVEIDFDSVDINDSLINFLVEMEPESELILYIKKNFKPLSEIIEVRKSKNDRI